MAEHVIVRQNSTFEIEFEARDPSEDESAEVQPVVKIHELTPYTMMLASQLPDEYDSLFDAEVEGTG